MQSKFGFVFACIGMLAAVAQTTAASVKARQSYDGYINANTDIDFSGTQDFQGWDAGVCTPIYDEFVDQISSIAVVAYATCKFYKTNGCPLDADSLTVTWDNPIPDLTTYGDGSWNDAIETFVCTV